MLLVDGIVFIFDEGTDHQRKLFVRGFGITSGCGNDEWRACLIDQDGVDLVNNGVVGFTLAQTVRTILEVVTQIVETKLIVGSVSDIGCIRFAARYGTQEFVNHFESASLVAFLIHGIGRNTVITF